MYIHMNTQTAARGKRILAMAMSLLLLLGAACSSDGTGLPVEKFMDSTAGYQYPGLLWGSSQEDTAKVIPMEEEGDSYGGGQIVYPAGQQFTLDGQTASGEVEFFKDKLGSLVFDFVFKPEDNAWYEARLEELTKLYGEPDLRTDHKIGTGETYRWTSEDERTCLELSSVEASTKQTVSIRLVSMDVVEEFRDRIS